MSPRVGGLEGPAPLVGCGQRQGAEPGDPAPEVEEVSGAAVPCFPESGAEGVVGRKPSEIRHAESLNGPV